MGSIVTESKESAMSRSDGDMGIGFSEINGCQQISVSDAGQNSMQRLHLEAPITDIAIQALQIEDGSAASRLFMNQK